MDFFYPDTSTNKLFSRQNLRVLDGLKHSTVNYIGLTMKSTFSFMSKSLKKRVLWKKKTFDSNFLCSHFGLGGKNFFSLNWFVVSHSNDKKVDGISIIYLKHFSSSGNRWNRISLCTNFTTCPRP
jgi:hypothetical protein